MLRKIGTVGEAAERFGVPTENIPPDILAVPVYVNPRLRTTLGYAKRSDSRGMWIEVHKCVFANPDQMRLTLAHEIAHHIAGLDAGHDYTWKAAALALGATGERCTTQAAANGIGIKRATRPRRVVARCAKCQTPVMRTKALPRGRVYDHVGCGGRIEAV